jgi:hypothetical protein
MMDRTGLPLHAEEAVQRGYVEICRTLPLLAYLTHFTVCVSFSIRTEPQRRDDSDSSESTKSGGNFNPEVRALAFHQRRPPRRICTIPLVKRVM